MEISEQNFNIQTPENVNESFGLSFIFIISSQLSHQPTQPYHSNSQVLLSCLNPALLLLLSIQSLPSLLPTQLMMLVFSCKLISLATTSFSPSSSYLEKSQK